MMKSPQRSRFILRVIAIAAIATALFSLWTHTLSPETPFENNTAAPVVEPRSSVQEYIDTLTLEEKIAGLLVLHTPGTNSKKLADFAAKHKPAGIILMGDNIPLSLEKLTQLTEAIQKNAPKEYPMLVAMDEEGCSVKRLAADTFLCAPALGTQPSAVTKQAFAKRSQLLERVGVNLNFGIVADTTNNPGSFVYPRVFGGNPQSVAAKVEAAVEGSKPYTLTTIKHFPGHGATTADSHSSVPVINLDKQQWMHSDAPPFEAGINSGADIVMFGHLNYTQIDNRPATLSPVWHNIAREKLAFDGLIITDDLVMLQHSGMERYQSPADNAVSALKAGTTLLLYVTDHGSVESQIDIGSLIKNIAKAVRSGALSEKKIDRNLERVLNVRKTLR